MTPAMLYIWIPLLNIYHIIANYSFFLKIKKNFLINQNFILLWYHIPMNAPHLNTHREHMPPISRDRGFAKSLHFALFIIGLVGLGIIGVGLAAFGGHHDQWPVGILSKISQVNAILIMGIGAMILLIVATVYASRDCRTQQVTEKRAITYPPKLSSPENETSFLDIPQFTDIEQNLHTGNFTFVKQENGLFSLILFPREMNGTPGKIKRINQDIPSHEIKNLDLKYYYDEGYWLQIIEELPDEDSLLPILREKVAVVDWRNQAAYANVANDAAHSADR